MEILDERQQAYLSLIRCSEVSDKESITQFIKNSSKPNNYTADDLSVLSDDEIQGLKIIDLSDQSLNKIPKKTRLAKGLKYLDLSFNNIIDFEGIDDFENLEYLLIENAHLKIIPSEIFKLPNLRFLSLRNNELHYVTYRIGKLTELQWLDLESNLLTMLPEQTGDCYRLLHLNVSKNNISYLPEKLGNLKFLTELNLANNELRTLSPAIGNLKNLQVLNLMFNNLRLLPTQILQLDNLISLKLNNNNLDELPPELSQMPKLADVTFEGNPLLNMPELRNNGLQNLRTILEKPETEHSKIEKIPVSEVLKKSLQRYVNRFSEFLSNEFEQKIELSVQESSTGYRIDSDDMFTENEIGEYLEQFEDAIGEQANRLDELSDKHKKDNYQIFELKQNIREYENEKLNMEYKIQNYYDKIMLLKGTIKEQQELINSLKFQVKYYQPGKEKAPAEAKNEPVVVNIDNNPVMSPSISNSPRFTNNNDGGNGSMANESQEKVDVEDLLMDIYHKAIRLQERKYTRKLEDLHNEEFTDFLRDKGYIVTDQTFSGKSNTNAGQLDIMLRRRNGTPVSIIEAFRLSSCGQKNTVISKHIYKLLHNYDTTGHGVNFILVYAEAPNFTKLWRNYSQYVEKLNSKPDFDKATCPIVSFDDTKISDKSEIKIGLAKHRREDKLVKVYHVFINMYVE